MKDKFCYSNAKVRELFKLFTEKQQGRCAICGKKRKLNFDHDHSNDSPRALLCDRCNLGIGCLEENPEIFRRCIEYIEFHKANPQPPIIRGWTEEKRKEAAEKISLKTRGKPRLRRAMLAQIIEMHKQGIHYDKIAKKADVTSFHIRRIIKKHLGKSNDQVTSVPSIPQ